MASASDFDIATLPGRKTQQGLFKRRRVSNDTLMRPHRLDFSDTSFCDDERDDALVSALMDDEALAEHPGTPGPKPAAKPVIPEFTTPRKYKFDLTAWRRAKLTFTSGDDFCRLAHDCEKDGSGSANDFNISLLQLRNLINAYAELASALQAVKERSTRKVDLTIHLGDKLHARVNTPYICLNLRIMERGASGFYPTKVGIALRAKEVEHFGGHIQALEELLDERQIEPCFHANPEGEICCIHCSPYPDVNAGDDSDDY
jgi:hypothetical protein